MAVKAQSTITLARTDDGKTSYVHTAYLTPDGTFTKVLPGENLLNINVPIIASNNGSFYPTTSEILTDDSGTFTRIKRTKLEINPNRLSIYSHMPRTSFYDASKLDGKTVVVSYDVRASVEMQASMMATCVGSDGSDNKFAANGKKVNITKDWQRQFVVGLVHPSFVTIRVNPQEFLNVTTFDGVYVDFKNYKVEIIGKTEPTVAPPYTPSPQDDPINAYPAKEGTYSDFNATGSDDPDDYVWKPFRGIPGKDGYTPVKGVDYFDGKPGQDGKSSRLWIKYSQKADGNPMTDDPTNAVYTGYATTLTDTAPTDYKAYKWQQTRGKDGEGIPGEPGADGATSYLHIKYSNDGGKTFTGNSGEDVGAWIGQYVDFTKTDSAEVADYTWNKVAGDDGKDGVGVKSTTVTYQSSTSGTVTPTGAWSPTIPTVAKGNYLWTKTLWTYTDNTTKLGYSVSYVPKDGEPGAPGKDGSKDVPYIFIQAATPTSPTPKKGDTWWVGDDINTATAFRLYDGTDWVDQTIQQAVLNIKTLNAITVNGAHINGSEFANTYSFTDVDQNKLDGTLTIKDSTITNVGTINKGSTTDAHNYKTVDSPITKVAQMFKGADQTTLEQSYELTTNGLYLRQGSVSGLLTVDMLYDSGWVPLTVTNGTGKVYIRKYMKRWMLRFDNYSYNGTAQVTTIPEAYNPKTSQMLNAVIWTADPAKPSEKFQLNVDGGLHKVTNVSAGTAFTTYVEIYSATI